MLLGGLQKLTLIDYPGKVACTVFTIGCNFRCPFCYSGELVLPEKIKNQPKISEKDFFDFLKQRKGLLDGCVLCGGEPTIHKDLPEFCQKIKKMGYGIKLDTNGSNPELLKKLIDARLIDYAAMDIKAPLAPKTQNSKLKVQNYTDFIEHPRQSRNNSKLKTKYEEMTGVEVNLEALKKSIEILKQGKIGFEFRTTVAPGLTRKDILEMADYIKGKNTSYFFQEFNNQKEVLNPEILNLLALKEEEIETIIKEIKPKFKTCGLR